jgi:hypothetical protein
MHPVEKGTSRELIYHFSSYSIFNAVLLLFHHASHCRLIFRLLPPFSALKQNDDRLPDKIDGHAAPGAA